MSTTPKKVGIWVAAGAASLGVFYAVTSPAGSRVLGAAQQETASLYAALGVLTSGTMVAVRSVQRVGQAVADRLRGLRDLLRRRPDPFDPDWAIYPGEHVREVMEGRGMTVQHMVDAGVPELPLGLILSGKRSICPDMAGRLEEALQVPARFWLNLQANFDERLARGIVPDPIDP